MPIIVEGIELIRPQAVSVVDDRPVVGPQAALPTTVALAARADGGPSRLWVEVTSFAEARRRFRSGVLVDLAERVFSPSSGNPGATRMLLYRVDNLSTPAAGSALTLNSTGPLAAITLASRDVGVHTNQIRVKNTYDAVNDAYNISVGGYDSVGTVTRNAIQRPMFGIKYLGSNATATVAITATTLTLTAGAGEGGSFNLADYTSIRGLVDAILGLGTQFWDVVVRASNPRMVPTQIDEYASTSVAPGATTLNDAAFTSGTAVITCASTATFPTSGTLVIGTEQITYTGKTGTTFTGLGRGANGTTAASAANSAPIKQLVSTMAYKVFKANNQALVDWFNNEEPYVNATKVTGKRLLDLAAYSNMTGGTAGAAPTNTDWQLSLDALQAQDAQLVCVGSESDVIHAMVDAHCQLMSQQGYNRERNAIVGGLAGESSSTAILRAQTLGSFRTSLVWPGYVEIDPVTRAETVRSPMYAAATVAGLASGQVVGQPVTRKTFRAVRPEVRITPLGLDALLMGGVLPIEFDTVEGARVVQGVTTYQIGVDPEINILRRELSSRMAADALVRLVRDQLADFALGDAIDTLFLNRAKAKADAALRRARTLGLIVASPGKPAYTGLRVRVQADALTVSFGAYVVSPANYVVLEASLSTYQGGIK
jgi:hypothetical protein